MPLSVQQPSSGPDLTRRNARDTIYLKGDDSTDDSIRLIFSVGENIGTIELRQAGVWNNTDFLFSPAGVKLGRDLILSSGAGFLATVNPSLANEFELALIPHVPFDDDGTRQPRTPFLGELETFEIFTGHIGEKLGTEITQLYPPIVPTRVNLQTIFEAGSISANEDITLNLYAGLTPAAVLFSSVNLPKSLFIANQPVVVDWSSALGSSVPGSIFAEFKSTANFSLKTDNSGNLITKSISRQIKTAELVVEDQILLGNDLETLYGNDLELILGNQF